jgi:hypothetical protein
VSQDQTHHSARQYLSRLFGAAALIGVLVASLCFGAVPVAADDGSYYVDSSSGSDSNSGTSASSPWRSLAPVNSRTFGPGDTIYLARGSEWDGGLTINGSGAEGRPLTVTAYGDGERPIIHNDPDVEWSRVVTIGGSWVVFESALVRDAHEFGVAIDASASHVTVRDCEITAVGIGIGVMGQYNLVTENAIHNLYMVHDDPDNADDDYGALAMCLYDSYNEVSYNHMYYCTDASCDYGTDGGAVEIYGSVAGSNIHHNLAQNGDGFIEIGGGAAIDTTIAYNVSFNNGLFTTIHLDGTFASDVHDLRVDNNTIVETAEAGWAALAWVGDTPSADTMSFRNNIVYLGDYDRLTNSDGFAHTNNLYYMANGNTQLGLTLGDQERLADPRFVDGYDGDLHLLANSPAIDGGLDLGYSSDFDDQTLPAGAAPDLGAYEYNGSGLISEPPPTMDKFVFVPMIDRLY